MRTLLVTSALALAGCNAGDFFPDWSSGGRCPGPWQEQVVAKTAAGEVVAATRDDCGFPDASLEYRLYRNGERFAEGSMQANHWARAFDTDAGVTTMRLYDQRCTLTAAALTCVRCTGADLSACDPR